MTELSRGANAPLATGPVEVAVAGAQQGSVDLMVFQLGLDRKVRTDADFVFFNQPASPEGAVALVAADRVTIDLTAVPADIGALAIAVSLDDQVPGSLAAIAGLAVTVSGRESHTARASGLTVERAAVLVEIYRRADSWKVRNVSAGWAAGLSALAGEHGVRVDETPAAQPRQSPPSVPRHPPAANHPTPGGFPAPGGSLPPAPGFVAPRPGGFVAPGGLLTGTPHQG